MAWRLARSLVQLRAEVRTLHPGTTVWTIGDEHHVVSDHVPNDDDVVCASDTLGDAGLDLSWYADQVRQAGLRGHPAPKYVIYDRRIASRSQGWRWRTYHGSNPHTDHVHVSVGVGPDGQSTGPYDNTSPWGVDDMSEITELVQQAVEAAGYDPGPIDGIPGPKTLAGLTSALEAGGEDGEDGRDGEDGKDATPAQIAASVSGWMEDHRDELRGADGKTPTRVQITGEVTEVA